MKEKMGQLTTGREERGTARKTLYVWRRERRVHCTSSEDAKYGVCRVWHCQALDKTPPSFPLIWNDIVFAHTADSDINAPICRTDVSYPIEQASSWVVKVCPQSFLPKYSTENPFKYSMVLKWWIRVWKLYQDRLSIAFPWMLISSMSLLADNWTGYVILHRILFFSLCYHRKKSDGFWLYMGEIYTYAVSLSWTFFLPLLYPF